MEFQMLLFVTLYLALLTDKSVLSDHTPSVSQLADEIRELKAQVEDLNSKVKFLLNAGQTDRHRMEPLGNNQPVSDYTRNQMVMAESPFIPERLAEVERILTDAPEEIGPQIYFATEGGGINSFSDAAHNIRTVVSSTEDLEGMAYDPVHDRIYYCSQVAIYRTNRQGTEVEILFHDTNAEYLSIFALAVDWITGNLYAASWNGKIFVCNTAKSLPLNCKTILQRPEGIYGIAVSPNEGQMYWADVGGSIMKAEMDGSNPVQVIGGLQKPSGIAVDYGSSQLFWADYLGNRIQSSTLAGEDIKTVVELALGFLPWGVAVHGNKVYWGSRDPPLLQSSTKDGDDIRTFYKEAHTAFDTDHPKSYHKQDE